MRPTHLRKDFRKTWFATQRFLNRNRWHCLVSLLLVLAFALFVLHRHDIAVLDLLRGPEQSDSLKNLSHQIGKWGDFLLFNLCGAFLLWLVGYLSALRWIQRLAIATLVAAVLAGITCNAFRFTMGRPRPYAEAQDGFYGFAGTFRGWDHHGFPSGHTATAFGSGVPVLAAAGPWGVPAVAVGGAVAWSRLYRREHYPTDVLVGAYIGCVFGIATGWPLYRVRRRLRRRRKSALARNARRSGNSALPVRELEPRSFRH